MSWYQLIDIFDLAVEDHRLFVSQPPLACPNDGEPLEDSGDGTLHCKWDGWEYPRDWVARNL